VARRPHFVIMANGGPGWLGGRHYPIYLVKALLLHRGHSEAFDVSVLVRGADELQQYEALAGQLRTCDFLEARLAKGSIASRIRQRIKRARGWVNPRFEELVDALEPTFVYPFTSQVVPSADWIPDFQYHHHPDRMSKVEIADRERQFSAIAKNARQVVLSSFEAERDCLEVFPNTRGRTAVLQFRTFADTDALAADPRAVVAKYHLPERFALISNWLLPTKNHLLVLEALARMPAAARKSVHVVCTGEIYDYRNPGFYNQFLTGLHTLGLREQISVLGVIPKIDQTQLLRAATLYLQPSLFEGWNTSVEDARMFGKRILLSDIGVHREQAPPNSVYFDPHDSADLAEKLQAAMALPVVGDPREIETAALVDYQVLQTRFATDFLKISRGVEAAS
jgi:hypothetical protein